MFKSVNTAADSQTYMGGMTQTILCSYCSILHFLFSSCSCQSRTFQNQQTHLVSCSLEKMKLDLREG